MSLVKEYELGDTARFRTVFRDTQGNVIEPDKTGGDHLVSIEIKDLSTGDIIVSSQDMFEISDTAFRYDWQTTQGMSQGEYEVEVQGEFQGDTALNRDRVRLVDIITE